MQKPKFEIGDRVKHYKYGKGIILGNYHKRGEYYYWHIQYDNNTFGYNTEQSLKLISNSLKPYIEFTKVKYKYNPNYGDDRICYPCGCKYCDCSTFEEENKTKWEHLKY